MEIRLAVRTKGIGESEADAEPIAVIGGDIGAGAFDEDGEGFDGLNGGHNNEGLM